MFEILNIKELIENQLEIRVIDNEISFYNKELVDWVNYYDFQKSRIDYLQRIINQLRVERDLLVKSIIEKTKLDIKKLSDNYGKDYFVYYSKEDRFIQIHRDNCEKYKSYSSDINLKSMKYKTFEESKCYAHSLIKEINTDISDDCKECKPYMNLHLILNSI